MSFCFDRLLEATTSSTNWLPKKKHSLEHVSVLVATSRVPDPLGSHKSIPKKRKHRMTKCGGGQDCRRFNEALGENESQKDLLKRGKTHLRGFVYYSEQQTHNGTKNCINNENPLLIGSAKENHNPPVLAYSWKFSRLFARNENRTS